jgi:hypothetical protein
MRSCGSTTLSAGLSAKKHCHVAALQKEQDFGLQSMLIVQWHEDSYQPSRNTLKLSTQPNLHGALAMA